jgi:hypothetical protein
VNYRAEQGVASDGAGLAGNAKKPERPAPQVNLGVRWPSFLIVSNVTLPTISSRSSNNPLNAVPNKWLDASRDSVFLIKFY